MESCRRQIKKKRSAFICCVCFPGCCFFVSFHFLVSARKTLQSGVTDTIVQIWFKKSIPICFSKQYFITVFLPFYPPIFFTCIVRVFSLTVFFYLSGSVQLKESKSNQSWFHASYLHFRTLLFFSLHSVVCICFVFVKIPSCACKVNHGAVDIWFNNSVVIMQCHFSVSLRQILRRLSNPTQNVPSCSFY